MRADDEEGVVRNGGARPQSDQPSRPLRGMCSRGRRRRSADTQGASVAVGRREPPLSTDVEAIGELIIGPPPGGWIIDRFGKPIAINRSDFRVDLIPEQLGDVEQTLTVLTGLLDLTVDDVARIIDELKVKRGYQPVQVAENVPYENYAAVTVRLPELPGVQPMRGFSRFYPPARRSAI